MHSIAEIDSEICFKSTLLAGYVLSNRRMDIQKKRHLWVIAFENAKTLFNTHKAFACKIGRIEAQDINSMVIKLFDQEVWSLRLVVMNPYHRRDMLFPLEMRPVAQPTLVLKDIEMGNRILRGCCLYCKKEESPLKCSNCKIARYCDNQCQRADWKGHKPLCQKFCAKAKKS